MKKFEKFKSKNHIDLSKVLGGYLNTTNESGATCSDSVTSSNCSTDDADLGCRANRMSASNTRN